MTNSLLILGNGAPDKGAADLTAAPAGSVYIDETNLPSALTADEIADRIFNVGQVIFAINQYQAPLAGSWVKWTFGSTLDPKKYPILSDKLPKINNQTAGLMYGTNNSFPRVANTGGWDSGSDEIRDISGAFGTLNNSSNFGGGNSNWGSGAFWFNQSVPSDAKGAGGGYWGTLNFDTSRSVPSGAVNQPNFFGVSMWVKADPSSNPMSAQMNRELKTVAGFIYDPQTHKVSEFEHPVQEGVSLSKFFTAEKPSLSAAVNEIEIIKEGKWIIVPDLRSTLKSPALSYDATKTWQTYKVGEPLPENFTLEPAPDFDRRYQTILFNGEKWMITTNSKKEAEFKAKDNLAAYYALIPQSIGLRKQPTDDAASWANGQTKIASNEDSIESEGFDSSLLTSLPPRPDGPLSLHNSNWFMQT